MGAKNGTVGWNELRLMFKVTAAIYLTSLRISSLAIPSGAMTLLTLVFFQGGDDQRGEKTARQRGILTGCEVRETSICRVSTMSE